MNYENILEQYNLSNNVGFILEHDIYAYKKYMFANKSYKNRTVSEELNYLHNFDTFLKLAYPTLTDIKELKDTHIKSFQRFCIDYLNNKNKTFNKKLRAIRKFLDYITLVRHKLEYNPASKLAYLKNEKETPPGFIPIEKLKSIINSMDELRYGIRDKCITKFIAYMGLHLQEVFDLRVDNLDMKNKKIVITREGSECSFPISDNLYIPLKEYLHLRNDFLSSSETGYTNYLFLSHTGNEYTQRAYQYKFKLALDIAGINKNFTPRNLRASFGYYMAQQNNEDTLKKVLNQQKVSQYFAMEIKTNPLVNI